ncbi:MAG TPA: 3-dehydroquinate synthase [Verrucomicrobiota bacterium]|nr:3-dehydroquinate synthase [Verrucomicrobiota bacterium]
MSLIERQVDVSYRHQVWFTQQVFSKENTTLRDTIVDGQTELTHKVLLVMDEALCRAQPNLIDQVRGYFKQYSDCLKLVCKPMQFEGGERTKNSYFHVSEIHSKIEMHHIDRHSYVVAVGGGALLDMVGLASATAHRGVRHVRIPSTTLSQADSGVGVKNGINAFGKKNFIGAFAPPFAVINDFDLISSLSERDKRNGYVEAAKVALIRDRAFFEWIEDNADALAVFEHKPMQRLIHRCAELHINHIATSGDPFEFGSSRPLDFGHWAAHKLEQLSEYCIRHGEAVAVGVALDVIYARRERYLSDESAERILTLLERLGFELFANELLHEDESGTLHVINGLEEFREHLGGKLTITLLRELGQGFEVHGMNLPLVIESIYELRDRQAGREQSIVPARA